MRFPAGMARVLQWYELTGYNGFNLALYSGPLNASRGWRVHLSMIARTAMLPYYRSDAMHMERSIGKPLSIAHRSGSPKICAHISPQFKSRPPVISGFPRC